MEGSIYMWIELIVTPTDYSQACHLLDISGTGEELILIRWQKQLTLSPTHTAMHLLEAWGEAEALLHAHHIVPTRVSLWCDCVQDATHPSLTWEPILLMELEERNVHLCVRIASGLSPEMDWLDTHATPTIRDLDIQVETYIDQVPSRAKCHITLTDGTCWEVIFITPAHLKRYQEAFDQVSHPAICLPIHHTLLLGVLDASLIRQTIQQLLIKDRFRLACKPILNDPHHLNQVPEVVIKITAQVQAYRTEDEGFTHHDLHQVSYPYHSPTMDFLTKSLNWAEEWLSPRKIGIQGHEKWQLICQYSYQDQWKIDLSPTLLRQIWRQRFQLVLAGHPISTPLSKPSS